MINYFHFWLIAIDDNPIDNNQHLIQSDDYHFLQPREFEFEPILLDCIW